jgi:hypothetical protein
MCGSYLSSSSSIGGGGSRCCCNDNYSRNSNMSNDNINRSSNNYNENLPTPGHRESTTGPAVVRSTRTLIRERHNDTQ